MMLLKYFHSSFSQFTSSEYFVNDFLTEIFRDIGGAVQTRIPNNLLISVNLAQSFSLEGNCQNREIGCTSIPPPLPLPPEKASGRHLVTGKA